MLMKSFAPLAGFALSLSVFAAALATTVASAKSNSLDAIAPLPLASVPNALRAPGRTIDTRLALGGETLASTWYLPAESSQPRGWVILFHGFMRNKGHMRALAERLQAEGLVVLTPTVGVGNLNDAAFLARLADDLGALEKIPGTDIALPERLVMAGHSAGGKNALSIAASMRARFASRLSGVLLLDPVEKDDAMKVALATLAGSGIDVFSLLASPGSCNAKGNAASLIQQIDAPFKGVRFAKGTHCDAEGDSTDFLCKVACGTPAPKTVANVQDFAVSWIKGYFAGARDIAFFPGGERFEAILRDAEGESLD